MLAGKRQGASKEREAKRTNWSYFNLMFNERAGQFCKAVRSKVTRQFKPEARIGLKTKMIWY